MEIKRFTSRKKIDKKWEEWNKHHQILKYLLAKTPNKPKDEEVSNRDREVAATVIQWLGSPIGQTFIKELNF